MTIFNQLSIVVPVGPDDSVWQDLLKELTPLANEIEIILSACQPRPKDIDLPENVTWLDSPQGRARQLNAGVIQVTKSVIWFLHADTRFTTGVIDAMRSYLAADKQGLGYFRLKFSQDGPVQMRLNAWAANFRSRYFGLPFGDQGLVINKSALDQLQGFDETVTLGEDLDLVVRARAQGISLQELPAELISSARRYQQYGWLVTTVRHVFLTWHLTRQAKQRLTH